MKSERPNKEVGLNGSIVTFRILGPRVQLQWVHQGSKLKEDGPGPYLGVKQSLKQPPDKGEVRALLLGQRGIRVLLVPALIQSFSRMKIKNTSQLTMRLHMVGVHLVLGILER